VSIIKFFIGLSASIFLLSLSTCMLIGTAAVSEVGEGVKHAGLGVHKVGNASEQISDTIDEGFEDYREERDSYGSERYWDSKHKFGEPTLDPD